MKDFPGNPEYKYPNMTKFDYGLEQGSKKGFMHIHVMVSFDGYCQLRIEPLKKLFQDVTATKGYTNVTYYPDTEQLVKNYIHKQQGGDDDDDKKEKDNTKDN